jgi:alpha-1,2-mannosyltransferase
VGKLPFRRSVREGRQRGDFGFGWVLGCGLIPVALFSSVLLLAVGHRYAFDLHQFWQGANDVLHGRSPYPSRSALPSSTEASSLTPLEIQQRLRFPYPAATAVVLTPLAALPFWLAAAIFTGICIAALVLALWLSGVRDWRCYGVMFASIPVIGAVRLGTFTPLLLLTLAAAWRYRERRWVVAAALAAGVVAKLFLWPVLVWLVATRRFRTAATTGALVVAVSLAGWAIIGFAGLRDYPHLLGVYSLAGEAKGYSDVALGMALGLPPGTARALGLALGLCALAAVFLLAARRGEDSDRRAFVAAIAASLLLTPLVWLHYLALLYVPIAISRRRLSAVWFVPLLLWASPYQESHGDLWRLVLAFACAVVVLGLSAVARPRVPRREGRSPALARSAPA